MKRRYIGFLAAMLFSILCWGDALASERQEGEIEYTVSFVDTSDYNTKIFNTQRGNVAEGTVINVSFPKQIIGTDGISGNRWWIAPRRLLYISPEPTSIISNTSRGRR